ncbi:MAG TPA: hypothetical protein VGQ57_12705 [Polyangiaceae bacterium]|jgi:hypothetical protein|nr:hypothetical protein [Polyangiaceae bacterium]
MRFSAIFFCSLCVPSVACSKTEPKPSVPDEIAEAVAHGAIEKDAREVARRKKWALPSGPMLSIDPGKGLGPIRLGATVGTVERLMDKRCEVLTEDLCRYISRGVDFHLLGGTVEWIHVQRAGRPAGTNSQGEPVDFGFFNGAIPPDVRLGMIPKAVQEFLGPPERVEPVPQPNPATIVARDYYPGAVIEYDRYSNGKFILGGVRIVKLASGERPYEYAPPVGLAERNAAFDAAAAAAHAKANADTKLVR